MFFSKVKFNKAQNISCPYFLQASQTIKSKHLHKDGSLQDKNLKHLEANTRLYVNLKPEYSIHFHLPCGNSQHFGHSLVEFEINKNQRVFIYYKTMTLYDSFLEVDRKMWKISPLVNLFLSLQKKNIEVSALNVYKYMDKAVKQPKHIQHDLSAYYPLFKRNKEFHSSNSLNESLKMEIEQFSRCSGIRLNTFNLDSPNIVIDSREVNHSVLMRKTFPSQTFLGRTLGTIFNKKPSSDKDILWATIEQPAYITKKNEHLFLGTKNLVYCTGIYINIPSCSFRALLHYQPPHSITDLKEWFEKIFKMTKAPSSVFQVILIQNENSIRSHEKGDSTYELFYKGLEQVRNFLTTLQIHDVSYQNINNFEFIIDPDGAIIEKKASEHFKNFLSDKIKTNHTHSDFNSETLFFRF